ncbi:MAG: (2Fe-2S)-binding protein [Thermomicrobiales bacterium]|nr:(2Fe-2S)-binding protein [Thermomicrobiales bacterium]
MNSADGHGASRLGEQDAVGGETTIVFDGRSINARDGESLAAALLASGVRVFRTMLMTGDQRGPFCMVGRCTDCLVVVDGVPNARACMTPVRAGMRVETQRGLSGPAVVGEGA